MLTLIASTAVIGLSVAVAEQRQMPPAWPYAQRQLPPGEIPPQAPAPRTPPVTTPNANPDAPPAPLLQAKGSTAKFTQQQVANSYAPADWFPDSHPPMPEVVAHGKPGVARACGLCHLPDGRGRPENAPLQGLPYDSTSSSSCGTSSRGCGAAPTRAKPTRWRWRTSQRP